MQGTGTVGKAVCMEMVSVMVFVEFFAWHPLHTFLIPLRSQPEAVRASSL